MYHITKSYRLEASHRLEGWPDEHPCHRDHGHSYRVELTLEGMPALDGPTPGAVRDFGEISVVWRKYVHDVVDHRDWNEVTGMPNTTAELLAQWIHDRLRPFLPELKSVRVWETETGSAIYQP